MRVNAPPTASNRFARRGVLFVVFGLLLLAVLAVLFHRSFLPGYVHFNNDNPLGAMMPRAENFLQDFTGRWQDLNSVGGSLGSAAPTLSGGILALGAVFFGKFYAPLALLILGLCAWMFFRQLQLSPLACTLGGLAAALNSAFLSTACWGVAGQPIAFGLSYLALAAVVSPSPKGKWARLPLAGFAVGLAVMEALDIGAIFSMVVAAFALVYTLLNRGGSLPRRTTLGALQVAVIAMFAVWISFGVVKDLVGTQIQGVAGMQDTAEAKAQRWDWATQWSMPKGEVLGLAIPGLFGYRMDSSQHGIAGGDYWGIGGRDPSWERYFANPQQAPAPHGPIRYGGGGGYVGLLTLMVALWAAAQALRKQGSVFSPENRKFIGFCLLVMGVSLLLAFGRFAPFYGLIYHLPFFSTMRNPAKFMHVFTWTLMIVFAFGVDGLSRRYLSVATTSTRTIPDQVRSWWSQVTGFDRKWTLGCLAALALSVVGWLIYGSSRASLESYLQMVQFSPEQAKAIASFSIAHVGWFIVRLVLVLGLLTLVLSGCLAGARARWASVLLGGFLIVDLGITAQPWILHWDYQEKYATNPIIEELRNKPYEHRVAILPSWLPGAFGANKPLLQAEQFLDQLYEIEWKQQHFQYYSIQTLDVVQMPRVPADLDAFEKAVQFERNAALHPQDPQGILYLLPRRWQLTNTRYLLGTAALLDLLNQALDPLQHRFRILDRFNLEPKPGIAQPTRLEELTATPATNGTYALFEFTGALPRAKLYTDWQVPAQDPAVVKQFINTNLNEGDLDSLKSAGTNDFLTLKELGSKSFDPTQTVLLANPISCAKSPESARASTNAVTFTSYKPKDIKLHAQASAPGVLLLNDKYDPDWKVTVDGQPATLLRCNYLMRGVQVPAGEHEVEFRFAPPHPGLYANLAAIFVGLVLAGYLLVQREPEPAPAPSKPAPAQKSTV